MDSERASPAGNRAVVAILVTSLVALLVYYWYCWWPTSSGLPPKYAIQLEIHKFKAKQRAEASQASDVSAPELDPYRPGIEVSDTARVDMRCSGPKYTLTHCELHVTRMNFLEVHTRDGRHAASFVRDHTGRLQPFDFQPEGIGVADLTPTGSGSTATSFMIYRLKNFETVLFISDQRGWITASVEMAR